MIRFAEVSFGYGDKPVLDRFSLTVADGEAVCLVGASGCGKTTALRLAAGLEQPAAGTVTADGAASVVFQENRLLPWMTAAANLRLAAPDADAALWLARLGIPQVGRDPVGTLSGGMRRRVAIARALAAGGDYLLLDEPFNGLDAAAAQDAAHWIRQVFAGKPILMVSHHAEDAALLGAVPFAMENKNIFTDRS